MKNKINIIDRIKCIITEKNKDEIYKIKPDRSPLDAKISKIETIKAKDPRKFQDTYRKLKESKLKNNKLDLIG